MIGSLYLAMTLACKGAPEGRPFSRTIAIRSLPGGQIAVNHACLLAVLLHNNRTWTVHTCHDSLVKKPCT